MRDHEIDNNTFTISTTDSTFVLNDAGTYTITSDYSYDTSSMITTSTLDIGSLNIDWDTATNGKYIDFDILDKYPTAKTLYNQFISVYNMCEEEDKLNGE